MQREGVYRFRGHRRTAAAAARATPSAAAAGAGRRARRRTPFRFLGHRFPLVGAHEYGSAARRFGGGRGHQGQDIFAACGTPVVAARGGKVAFKQFHARAGHYIVIDGAGTGVDYAYMHLRDAALVDNGDRVRTGQLSATSATPAARAAATCTSRRGRRRAGTGRRAFRPAPGLQAWDAQS